MDLDRTSIKIGKQTLDGLRVVKLIQQDKRGTGAIAIETSPSSGRLNSFVLFNCMNIILATGGSADVYYCTVYKVFRTVEMVH